MGKSAEQLNPFLPKVRVSFIMGNSNNVNRVFHDDVNDAERKRLFYSGFPEALKGNGELKWRICNSFECCD